LVLLYVINNFKLSYILCIYEIQLCVIIAI
jgi:hypothetical protein